MGCTLSGSLISAVLSGCSNTQSSSGWTPSSLTNEQLEVAADLAEVILPPTETPGAKDAKVKQFIDKMIDEFYAPDEKKLLLSSLDNLSQTEFSDLNFKKQTEFVSEFIVDEKNHNFFLLFKQTVLMGFFTSEIGATQVLQYDPIPGDYWGCESLEDLGDKTWAT